MNFIQTILDLSCERCKQLISKRAGDALMGGQMKKETQIAKQEGRICTKCNIYKPKEDFLIRKENNRLRSWCKICMNKRRIEIFRRIPSDSLDKKKGYFGKFGKKDSTKLKARQISQKITRKDNCEICKEDDLLERHHWDYNKPEIFVTLCRDCHRIQHHKPIKLYDDNGI